VRLGSRAFDILTALIEHAGEVVSKEALIARVWPATLVEEASYLPAARTAKTTVAWCGTNAQFLDGAAIRASREIRQGGALFESRRCRDWRASPRRPRM
jgi:Transcriptional regulatory protein, C terminal